ncbi:MarR family winged helix-turn-helix transcriptional regulator [Streptomyces iconiensis]|uniref:MarR family transcriptional regulator n=1 Tax=Streptomyces iconiensis TaxID=1384038 RepID=A0ABT6ZR10_9ACTN|nr:MarR family transcriptional regulator [Streptomyces iconiensis]MDJ1131497.1 MarR family transcriptional regulator [Streptomyces iconiensis]
MGESERSATERTTGEAAEGGSADAVFADWQRERPDLDVTALATIGRLAFVAENIVAPAGERAVGRQGIGKGDFDVLATLRRTGEPYSLSPSALSAALMMSRAGMTKRLDRLERTGLVRRALDTADRRSFRITLTEEGLRVADAAVGELATVLMELVAPLTREEREGLDRGLRALLRANGGGDAGQGGPS